MVLIICTLGFSPFIYASGGKGFHVEIFFDKPVDGNKLSALNNIIVSRFKESKGQCLDKSYPSASAYRVFGSHHYKTRKFTMAVKYSLQLDMNGNISQVDLKGITSINESWEMFANATINDSSLLDNIIEKNPITFLPETDISKRAREHASNYSAKPYYYNADIIKRIYESGLFGEYKRHFTAFQLGRYFKHCLNMTEHELRDAIILWLMRHYRDHTPFLANRGITPFGEDVCRLIKSTYEECCKDTLLNCINGYNTGKPFEREKVEIFHQAAFDYLNGLDYSLNRKKALIALLDYAMQFSSLDLGFSYTKLLEIFNVNNRNTLGNWLTIFEEDNVLVCIRKGSIKTKLTSQYRLMLPDYCYRILESKNKVERPSG
jgi:hypothetical protein